MADRVAAEARAGAGRLPASGNHPASAGQEKKLTLNMEKGGSGQRSSVGCRGQTGTRRGLLAIAEGDNGPALGDVSTDADGRYAFRLPSGTARLYFDSLPEGFVYPDLQLVQTLEIHAEQADIEDLDFRLQRRKADAP
jgi:hypothetical protein